MRTTGLSFHHPLIFALGSVLITAGVLAHIPMLMHSAAMGYRMVGMAMDTTMLLGMALIPVGLMLAWYGLMPRLTRQPFDYSNELHFHLADDAALNRQHWTLVAALLLAVAVDVMKPATLGFVMPGMVAEYAITKSTAGSLAVVALSGTALGSVLWGRLADVMGRRAAILLSALMFIGTAICGAMPAFGWNLAMCFLMGLSAGGLLPITFTLMAEMVPAHHRGWLLVALGGVGTALGFLLASGAAALLEPLFSWRILWLLGLPTGLLLILLNRFIPESPRFLAKSGLQSEARSVLARFSGEMTKSVPQPVTTKAPTGVTFRQLLVGPYGKITIGLVGSGLAWGLVNFGFLLWLPTHLRGHGMSMEVANRLLAQSGLLALPGILVVIGLYHYWSSIKTLILFIALTGVSLIVFFIIGVLHIDAAAALTFATVLLLISASGVIAMLIPYAAEIYPVHLRGTGAGLIAASSKAGGILGALCGVLGLFNHLTLAALLIVVPLLVFASLLWRSGVDTRGRRLEEIYFSVVQNND